ncbi:MAG: DUF1343 domain-containing protein [Kiritimatiellae bacterium]|nr:DUF1343 domain-containing protein [Kiritimatiellia bacterium]
MEKTLRGGERPSESAFFRRNIVLGTSQYYRGAMGKFMQGLDVLLERHLDWLAGRRVGLVAHPASVDAQGVHAALRLRACPEVRLSCLFGPEHGFSGLAAAGIPVGDAAHADWDIPVFSLYGTTRKPTPEMLHELDVLVFDLQDLPVRCYTYSSSLRLMLEAASECGKTVVVADRSAPLAGILDGPMLESELESFVGLIPTPYCYGLSTGELARLLADHFRLDLDLKIAFRSGLPAGIDAPWIPPSPGIKTRQTALTYPVTVCCEALPALDYGRGHPFVFQVMAAPWLDGEALARHVVRLALPALHAVPIRYTATEGLYKGCPVQGIRLEVEELKNYRPAYTLMHLLRLLTDLCGEDQIWHAEGSRPAFFDQLLGSRRPREALLAGKSPDRIAAEWETPLRSFDALRQSLNGK